MASSAFKSATASEPRNTDVLNSWKEIATYVGRGVRTVQRWEREIGFPVHRPRAKERSAVVASREEIDAWLRNASPQLQYLPPRTAVDERINTAVELCKMAQVLSAELLMHRMHLKEHRRSLQTNVRRLRQLGRRR